MHYYSVRFLLAVRYGVTDCSSLGGAKNYLVYTCSCYDFYTPTLSQPVINLVCVRSHHFLSFVYACGSRFFREVFGVCVCVFVCTSIYFASSPSVGGVVVTTEGRYSWSGVKHLMRFVLF